MGPTVAPVAEFFAKPGEVAQFGATIGGFAFDQTGLQMVEWRQDGGPWQPIPLTGTSDEWSFQPAYPDPMFSQDGSLLPTPPILLEVRAAGIDGAVGEIVECPIVPGFAPPIINDDGYVVGCAAGVPTILDALMNDINVLPDAVVEIVTQPANGTVGVVGTGVDTQLSFVPDAGFLGGMFTYRVTNVDGQVDAGTVVLTCNMPTQCVTSNLVEGMVFDGVTEFEVAGTVVDPDGSMDITLVEVRANGSDWVAATLDTSVTPATYSILWPTNFQTDYTFEIRAFDSVGNETVCPFTPVTITIATACGAELDSAGVASNDYVEWDRVDGNQFNPMLQISGDTDLVLPRVQRSTAYNQIPDFVPTSIAAEIPEASWSDVGVPTGSTGGGQISVYRLSLAEQTVSSTAALFDLTVKASTFSVTAWHRPTDTRLPVRILEDGGYRAVSRDFTLNSNAPGQVPWFVLSGIGDPERRVVAEVDLDGLVWSDVYLMMFNFTPGREIVAAQAMGTSVDPLARLAEDNGLFAGPEGLIVDPHVGSILGQGRSDRVDAGDIVPNIPHVETINVNNPDCYERTAIVLISEVIEEVDITGDGDHVIVAQIPRVVSETVVRTNLIRFLQNDGAHISDGRFSSNVTGVALFQIPAGESVNIEILSIVTAPGTYGARAFRHQVVLA